MKPLGMNATINRVEKEEGVSQLVGEVSDRN